MSQSDSAIHISPDRKSVLIPCGCGDDNARLRIGVWDEPDQTLFLGASFAAYPNLWGRIGEAWRALRGKPYEDSAILSLKTAQDLRDWISEQIEALEVDDANDSMEHSEKS
jgi:hypothetical protein